MSKEYEIFNELFERYPELEAVREEVEKAYLLLVKCYECGGKLLVCGNGGSAADAEHIVGELMKGFLLKRQVAPELKSLLDAAGCEGFSGKLQMGLPAISLCAHSGLMTAYINDVEAESVFAQQVLALSRGCPDVLLGLSTSGNSKNVVAAAKTAKALGLGVIAITGEKNSALSEIADAAIRLPETETFKIQELTLPVYHCLCAMVEEYFFG